MTDRERDEAAATALARAIHRAWPARVIEKAAPGWASVILVALRADPEGRAALVAALTGADQVPPASSADQERKQP